MEKSERYMFFSNLEQMRRQCDILLKFDQEMVESILNNGHDWAQDHIAEAKNNLDQVFDFMMNEIKDEENEPQTDMVNVVKISEMDIKNIVLKVIDEAKKKKAKKKDTTLCARGISAAKSKYDVYPSAYANGYAVQVCKGTKPGLDGEKRCSGKYCSGK